MEENPRMERFGRAFIAIVALNLLLLSVLGCDQISASPILSKSGLTATAQDGADTDLARADPNMESIGPDGAMRIYYQFVDTSGRVQFVERISEVPEAWRAQVGFVEMSQPPPLTPMAARRSWQISSERTAQILAGRSTALPASGTQREDVILYFASWCGYCKQAQAHLDREGVDYDLRNVDNDAVKNELREKTGRTGIPVLDFSGEILRGYSADQYTKAIRSIRS